MKEFLHDPNYIKANETLTDATPEEVTEWKQEKAKLL